MSVDVYKYIYIVFLLLVAAASMYHPTCKIPLSLRDWGGSMFGCGWSWYNALPLPGYACVPHILFIHTLYTSVWILFLPFLLPISLSNNLLLIFLFPAIILFLAGINRPCGCMVGCPWCPPACPWEGAMHQSHLVGFKLVHWTLYVCVFDCCKYLHQPIYCIMLFCICIYAQ